MMPLRPHGWINEPGGTSNKTLYLMINCTTSTGNFDLPSSLSDITSSGDTTLELECNLSSGGSPRGGIQTITHTISGTATYTKVHIVVKDGSVEKGHLTLRLNLNHFNPVNMKPFCWIKQLTVPATEIYFVLNASNVSDLTGPTITTNSSAHKVTLTYTTVAGTTTFLERYFPLGGYDPTTYEFVEICINQGTSLKGKGTTSQTDADSSGDD